MTRNISGRRLRYLNDAQEPLSSTLENDNDDKLLRERAIVVADVEIRRFVRCYTANIDMEGSCMWEFLLVVLEIWAFLFISFIFPIYVAIQARRKNHKAIATVIYCSYVFPPLLLIMPVVALVVFFVCKIYQPNLEADMRLQMSSGFGTSFCGATERMDDGTFITTQWLRFFFIPFVPIQSYRVSYAGTSTVSRESKSSLYFIDERLPLHWGQVLKSYALLFSIPLLLPMPILFAGGNTLGIVLLLVIAAAYVVCGVRLWRAR